MHDLCMASFRGLPPRSARSAFVAGGATLLSRDAGRSWRRHTYATSPDAWVVDAREDGTLVMAEGATRAEVSVEELVEEGHLALLETPVRGGL